MAAVIAPVDNPLRYRFLGMDFASPIVLLSGCVGFGEEYTRVEGFSNRDTGAVVLKGTTLEPRLGNPPHRVYETPSGMLNAIGLQNPGTDHVVRKILPTLDFSETRFIANVSGSTIEEYAEVARRFDERYGNGVLGSSCRASYADTLREFAVKMRARVCR